MAVPAAAVAHYRAIQRLQALAVLSAEALWSEVSLSDLSGSWSEQATLLVPALTGLQARAASAGSIYGATALAQQGLYEAPRRFVDPEAFSGFASDGRTLEGLLYSSVPHVKNLIGAGMAPAEALASGRSYLSGAVRTQVADAARAAAGVDISTRTNVGYVRMLNPPSCSRCSILAGKYYAWNSGFSRHPRCDCIHVPSTEKAITGAGAEGLLHDPYGYFESLSEADQDRLYTKASAQAIRDGGDIFQVVNSRARGMKPGGLVTTEGTSKRGNYGRGRAPRLTPEGIYSQGKSREETLRLLERNGYILPGGQDPAGVLRGSRDGYGQMGRGGTRVGARHAVERARATGVRNPATRATMTAAELRYFDAQMNWDAVSRGRNPFGRGKLTPELAAAVEFDFRRVVLGGDAVAKLTVRRYLASN